MSGARRMSSRPFIVVITAMAFSTFSYAQSARKISGDTGAREKLIGAWHLVRIDVPGHDGKSVPIPRPKGLLIYTRDGHMSVQLMYPESANTLSNEYVLNGYEASFGDYDVDETAHTDAPRTGIEYTHFACWQRSAAQVRIHSRRHLVIRSSRADEHWSVTWEHY